MSQYEIPSKQAGHIVLIGWDRQMGTFFAQVHDKAAEEDQQPVKLWLGGDFYEYPDDPARLVVRLEPWVDLCAEMLEQLRRDRQAAP